MAVEQKKKITDVRHPFYTANSRNWLKWRLTYEGGDRFIHRYLKKFSKREDNQDYIERKAVTYCPAFAKAAVNEVKNSIFQRTVDVNRKGGSESYQRAVEGLDNGVDLLGSSMNSFMGRRVLPELLTMSRVGIFVDMPQLSGPTIKDKQGKRPYVYWYPAEDILSWCYDDSDAPNEFEEVLLSDTAVQTSENEDFALPYNEQQRYRHIWKQYNEDGSFDGIYIQFYDENCNCIDKYGQKTDVDDGPIRLDIPRIPFVLLEISDSLLMDVANYQIAHLNLASSDISYILKSNFPFYVESFDPRTQSQHIKKEVPNVAKTTSTANVLDPTTQTFSIQTNRDQVEEVRVGVASGRRYPQGTNQPAFIHPSSEPLTASMAKQEQMKQEIRELVALAVSNLAPKAGAASNADKTQGSLEAGLSYIGLELEHGERQIAIFWANYEGGQPATVKYPENYSLKSDADRRAEAQALDELMPKLPSKTAQKEIAKQIARTLLSGKVSAEIMAKIESEIDNAVVVTTDPDIIKSDFESGFVGLDTASKIRGYPAGEVEKGKADHAERIARIAVAQAEGGGAGAPAKGTGDPASRGVKEASANPQAPSQEKTASRDNTLKPDTTSKVRGEGQ